LDRRRYAQGPTRRGFDAWRAPAAMPSGKQIIGAPRCLRLRAGAL